MQTIHIINKFANLGGSEYRAIELARILRQHADVRLWATGTPNTGYAGNPTITRISPLRGRFPRGGTQVFVGVYFPVGSWLRFSRPERQVIIYNTDTPKLLYRLCSRLAMAARAELREIVYACDLLRKMAGISGSVQLSPIDLRRFTPAERETGRFRVGRLSRDVGCKFHADDPALWRAMAGQGIKLRIMGARSQLGRLGTVQGIDILPEASETPEQFLKSIDCFLYRTSTDWLETFGRVVFEAMACGLPVVCGRRGGYAELIEHGRTGFLFDHDSEAMAYVLALRDDPALRARIGQAARAQVERIFGAELQRDIVSYFTARPILTGMPRPQARRALTAALRG